MNLEIPNDYKSEDFKKLNKILNDLKSQTYSLNKIEKILDEIDIIAQDNNYEFVSATYNEEIVDNNKINLSISLQDTEKFYVEKINIFGNNNTSENVIRNKLMLDEVTLQ